MSTVFRRARNATAQEPLGVDSGSSWTRPGAVVLGCLNHHFFLATSPSALRCA
jgi:hypothetical protein